MAHEIPYVATATVADLRDLEAKVGRAMEFRGARYLHVFVPCPLGWGADSASPSSSRGWPPVGGLPGLRGGGRRGHRGVADPAPVPVEDYLRPQRRYAHLFGEPGGPTSWPGSRRSPTATSPATGCWTRRWRCDGQALRDHARRGLEPGQQDRLLAHRAGGLRRPDAAVQRRAARPARTSRPGCTTPRPGATATSTPGGRSWSTTRSPR